MKLFTKKIAKVNLKILGIALIIYSFLMIPKVMAMSADQVMILKPYGLMAFFVAFGSAIIRIGRDRFALIKRVFDIVVSCVCLVLFAPLISVCAVAIKIFSPEGEVFYTQKRVGKGGKVFDIYKLRSMRPDAEKYTGAVWAKGHNDDRTIPYLGSFLRKSHIDEIPQFFNVLKGDMSVVGPRPERPEIVKLLKNDIPEYEKRLKVKPGITGLAQIRHRHDITQKDVHKKVKLDLFYIRKMCLSGEFAILFKTLIVVVKGEILKNKRKAVSEPTV